MKFVLKYSFLLSAVVLGTLKCPSPCSAKITEEEKVPGALQEDKSNLPGLRGVIHTAQATTTTMKTVMATVTKELNSHYDLVPRKLQTVTANLTNGVPVAGLNGTTYSGTYYALRNVPAGQVVTCTTGGGTGALYLYMYLNSVAQVHDCSSSGSSSSGRGGTFASCAVGPMATSTNVLINLHGGYQGYTSVTLTCSFPTSIQDLRNAVPLTGLSGAYNNSNNYFALRNVTVGALVTCTTSGGTGDVSLFVKIGTLTSIRRSPDCSSVSWGTNESCTVRPRQRTDIFVDIYTDIDYSGVTLTCSFLTASPTKNPTQPPTKLQTKPPTKRPTQRPTKRPTKSPTRRPTRPPTKIPTKPTKAPTYRPFNKKLRSPP